MTALTLCVASCATARPEAPGIERPSWQCRSEVRDGDVVASSTLYLEADGALRAVQNEWHWSAEGPRRARLLMEQWGPSDAAPAQEQRLLISLRFRSIRHLRISAFELRLGDVPLRLADGNFARDLDEPGNSLQVPVDELLTAAASARPLDAVGIGWRGGVALRIPIDVGAIARGRRALAQAIPRAMAMSRDPSMQCYDVSEDLDIIAAGATGGSGRGILDS